MLLNHIHCLVVEISFVGEAKNFFHGLFNLLFGPFKQVFLLSVVLEDVLVISYLASFINLLQLLFKLFLTHLGQILLMSIICVGAIIVIAVTFFAFFLFSHFLFLLKFLRESRIKVINRPDDT